MNGTIPPFAPGCFGSAFGYRDGSPICQACMHGDQCKPMHERNAMRLRLHLVSRDATPIQRLALRHASIASSRARIAGRPVDELQLAFAALASLGTVRPIRRKRGRPATVAHLTDDQRRAREAEMKKERRRMKAEAEGRVIKTRASLKSMTTEEKGAYLSARRKENRQRQKEEATRLHNPLYGRFG